MYDFYKDVCKKLDIKNLVLSIKKEGQDEIKIDGEMFKEQGMNKINKDTMLVNILTMKEDESDEEMEENGEDE